MKLTTFILLITLLQVSAATLAQRVTLKEQNTPLKSVLRSIRAQSGYDFFYDGSLISPKQKITVSLNNVMLEKALAAVLKNTELDYSIDGKIITLRKKEQPTLIEKIVSTFSAIDVHGTVVDETGKPMPGVTVKTKSGKQATTTDGKGEFHLRNVPDTEIIVLTFIGYQPLEITAKEDLGTLALAPSTSKLDEVQVIAYGQTTNRMSTGNISTVTAKDIEKSPVTNVLQALQGRVAGLNISQVTGFINGAMNINIQGLNSIQKGNDPFLVVDGVPYPSRMLQGSAGTIGEGNGAALNFINPMDIESISVLKDADATAIYGSQAANGAILITTKKGKAGPVQVSLNVQQGWTKVGRGIDMMNREQYLAMRREALANDGSQVSEFDYDLNGDWDTTRTTDWQKILLGRTARYSSYNAGISGGNGQTNYLFGATYNYQTPLMPGNFNNRKGSVHFNVNTASANQKFKFQFGGNYQDDYNLTSGYDLTNSAIVLSPVTPAIYKEDGTYNWQVNSSGNSTWTNPIAMLESLLINKTRALNTNALLSYELSQNLLLKSTVGYNLVQANETATSPLETVRPQELPYSKLGATYAMNQMTGWIAEPQLNYKRSFAFGDIAILTGASVQQRRSEGHRLYGEGYLNKSSLTDYNAAAVINNGGGSFEAYKYFGVFGNINYNYRQKYLFNLSGRRDGSSRFGPKNRFHNFWAVGLAWVFTQESWLTNNTLLSFGKLKFSYGTTGNDQVGSYSSLSLYQPIGYEVPYGGGLSLGGNSITNPYLQWEETQKMNVGLDLGFFKDRILLNANYFRNRSANQLLSDNLPSMTGALNISVNLPAVVQNTGLEFTVNTRNVESEKFRWQSNVNLSIPRNKLVKINGISSAAEYLMEGKSLSAIRLYHYTGVDPQTGLYTVSDANGKPTSEPDFDKDANVILDLAPRFSGGIENAFTYNDFSLSFLISFVKQYGANGFVGAPGGRFNFNAPTFLLDRWQKPGDIATYQRFNADGSAIYAFTLAQSSDRAYSDASYARLKNVSLSWNVPQNWRERVHLKNAKLFFQAQNLLTFTRYQGLDPEIPSRGIMPSVKVMTLGIQATF